MPSAHGKTTDVSVAHPTGGWMRVALLLLVIEKVIQHITVTLALYLDLGGIRAQLALDYRVFLFPGAIEAALFVAGAWGLLANKRWTPWLLITLALLDIAGEFVAQGTLSITITVSILVAFVLLFLSLFYWRVQHERAPSW